MADADPLHVLFVCSRNHWRSPTAEQLWRNQARLAVRSAGASRSARRRLTVADLRWADLILVMQDSTLLGSAPNSATRFAIRRCMSWTCPTTTRSWIQT